MQRPIGRFLLPTLLLAVGCGAVYWAWGLVQHVDETERIARGTLARIDRLQTTLDELADLELTYIVTGEPDRKAIERASSSWRRIVSQNSLLVSESLTAGAPAAKTVGEAITALDEVESRARENLEAGLDLMAADLIFTETHRTRRALRQQLRILRSAEADAVADARASDLKQGWAGMAGIGLLFAWTLIRSSRVPATVPARAAAGSPDSLGDLRETPKPDPHHSVDLVRAADLCTAIGRLKVEAELPGLLEQGAALLGAHSLVVWMAAGEELFPAAGHGYSVGLLNQLGPIGRAASNATAAAWRTTRLQTVAGDSTSRAAIVVPMLGPDRCIGVVAVEVSPGCETDNTIQAVTTMIAAQLAGALAAWPAASSTPPADVLAFERSANA